MNEWIDLRKSHAVAWRVVLFIKNYSIAGLLVQSFVFSFVCFNTTETNALFGSLLKSPPTRTHYYTCTYGS